MNRLSNQNEKRLAELFIKSIRYSNNEIELKDINKVVDSLKIRLCTKNNIPPDSIVIHIFENTEINAFAMPAGHIVVFTGLIEYSNNAEELSGVLAHEIGHLQKGHVKKKLIKEIGLTMLFTLAGGNGGNEIVREITKTLSSTAFDRDYEREADDFAVEALANANISPENFSNLMFRLSQSQKMPDALTWISTHPDSKERVASIIENAKKYKYNAEPIISTPWEKVKDMLEVN